MSTSANAAGPDQPALPTGVYDWSRIDAIPTRTGMTRRFFRSRTGTLEELAIHSTTLNPGEKAHEPHRHAEEELILLKEGTLDALINDRTETMSAGSLLFIAPNDLHGVTNTGNTTATYYVIKWFPPGMKRK